jgi:hypothetical protein
LGVLVSLEWRFRKSARAAKKRPFLTGDVGKYLPKNVLGSDVPTSVAAGAAGATSSCFPTLAFFSDRGAARRGAKASASTSIAGFSSSE